MIISHKHKFIFIKPHKTAGTSLELLLSRLCGPDDTITPLGFDPDPKVREKNNAKHPQNYYRKLKYRHWTIQKIYSRILRGTKFEKWHFREHLKAFQIQSLLDDEIWSEYKKISIVRNPWDQAVSWFEWQAKFGNTPMSDFGMFINNRYHSIWHYFTDNNYSYCVDHMIRFEHLKEDVSELLNQLSSKKRLTLPETKKDVRPKNSYRDYFNEDNLIEIVQFKNLQVIEKFNYEY